LGEVAIQYVDKLLNTKLPYAGYLHTSTHIVGITDTLSGVSD